MKKYDVTFDNRGNVQIMKYCFHNDSIMKLPFDSGDYVVLTNSDGYQYRSENTT